jgi:hypothetical protein
MFFRLDADVQAPGRPPILYNSERIAKVQIYDNGGSTGFDVLLYFGDVTSSVQYNSSHYATEADAQAAVDALLASFARVY